MILNGEVPKPDITMKQQSTIPLITILLGYVVSQSTNHIIVTTTPYSFTVIGDYNTSKDQTSYTGLAFDVLNYVTTKYNITYEVLPEKNQLWGTKSDNGSWNGIVGMVTRGDVDMGVNDFTITSDRAEAVDFSSWFVSDELTLLLRQPVKKQLGIFHPFDFIVWCSCMCCILLVGLVLYMLVILSKIFGIHEKGKISLEECLLTTTGIHLLQGDNKYLLSTLTY